MYLLEWWNGQQVIIFILVKKAGTLYCVYRRQEIFISYFFKKKKKSLSKGSFGPLLNWKTQSTLLVSTLLIASPASISPPLLLPFPFLPCFSWFHTDIHASPWACASRKVAPAPAPGKDLAWSESGFLNLSTTDILNEILLSSGRGCPVHLKMVFQYSLPQSWQSNRSQDTACWVSWGWQITPVENQQCKLIIVALLSPPLINLDIGVWCISGQHNWREVCWCLCKRSSHSLKENME